MSLIKLVIPGVILLGGFLVCTVSVYGTPHYPKKEKKSCTNCHAKVTSKDEMAKNLNSIGTCYKENDHSLAKCAP
jgi:hypothetical protein